MSGKIHWIPKLSAFAMVVGLVGGCASTSELNEVRATAEAAQQAAATARTTAGEAKSMARAAQSAAEAADLKADEALLSANNANSCCEQNSEKIDRMFKKSMMK